MPLKIIIIIIWKDWIGNTSYYLFLLYATFLSDGILTTTYVGSRDTRCELHLSCLKCENSFWIGWKIHSPFSFFQAQKYQALVDSLQENRLQLSLAELYYNEKHIHSLIDNLEERQQAAATNNNMARTLEQTVKTHKKEHGRLLREQQQVEKEIRCGGVL